MSIDFSTFRASEVFWNALYNNAFEDLSQYLEFYTKGSLHECLKDILKMEASFALDDDPTNMTLEQFCDDAMMHFGLHHSANLMKLAKKENVPLGFVPGSYEEWQETVNRSEP